MARQRKKDFPGNKWPANFPFVRCPEDGCLTGMAEQDKTDMPVHYRNKHKAIAFDYNRLIHCTHKDYKDYKAANAPHGNPKSNQRAPSSRKDNGLASATLSQAMVTQTDASSAPTSTDDQSSATSDVKTSNEIYSFTEHSSNTAESTAHPINFDALNSEAIEASSMTPKIATRKRRSKPKRSDHTTTTTYKCYLCDFSSNGKNIVSAHLSSKHNLSQKEKKLDLIRVIRNAEDIGGSTNLISDNASGAINDGSTYIYLNDDQHAPESSLPQRQRGPDRTVSFLDRLPPWNAASVRTHRNPARLYSTDTDYPANSVFFEDVWWCTLCYVPIGTLTEVSEHVSDFHDFMKLMHNHETKMIHYVAAHMSEDGRSVCHMPREGSVAVCGYVGALDIMEHIAEAHDVSEDDLLDNEETGRIYLTLAEVK